MAGGRGKGTREKAGKTVWGASVTVSKDLQEECFCAADALPPPSHLILTPSLGVDPAINTAFGWGNQGWQS